jgi:hypothetical protein
VADEACIIGIFFCFVTKERKKERKKAKGAVSAFLVLSLYRLQAHVHTVRDGVYVVYNNS